MEIDGKNCGSDGKGIDRIGPVVHHPPKSGPAVLAMVTLQFVTESQQNRPDMQKSLVFYRFCAR